MKTIFSSLIVVLLVSMLNIATSVAQDSSIYMYWTDSHGCKIQRAHLDGSNVTDLVPQVCGYAIAVDTVGGKMYWTETRLFKVRRANLDGSGVEDLVTQDLDTTSDATNIALDVAEGKMYWMAGRKIHRANLNGTNIEDIILLHEYGGYDISLDLDRRKLYWAIGNKIYRANLDGSNIEKLYDQFGDVFSIALDVDGGKIYYSGINNESGIHYFGMDDMPASRVADIHTLVKHDGATDIALDVDRGKMYWVGHADYSAVGRRSGVHSVNLDGTNKQVVVPGSTARVRNPFGIALGILQTSDGLRFTPDAIADQTFTVSTPVNLPLPSATGGTPPYIYTLTPLPNGLTFDTASRVLSGTPTTPGTTHLTYTATDAAGATAALTFSITVNSSGGGIDEPRPVPPDVRQIFGLDPFYQQYIDVGGLPVVASVQTNPYALKETAWLIQQMIGHRPDVLRALGQNRVRFSVMAHTEMTTQIPEHSDLVPGFYWDIRARGLGATSQRPAVSCGEENLLQYPGDPYWNENVLVHEFSHALHEMGLNTIDAGFDNRLNEAYNAAMAQGLWQGTYASTNKQEYWAEGAQSWFNTNRENDADHNHVNTRAELKIYDPGLAALLTEIFGDNAWRYTLPETRLHLPHLQGFDPQTAPTFQWPADSLACYQQLTDPEINSCGDKWVNLEAHPPSGLAGLKSPRTSTETAVIFVNRTGTAISYYWIDFDGNEKFYGRVVTVHAVQQSFVGHIWLVKDDTGKNLAVFHAVEQTGRAIVSTPDTIFISPVSPQTFEVGTYVHLTLPAATGGTGPYTYSVSALPAGLNFDAGTRVISGTPTTATPATPVTYTATDATGDSASLTFTITVRDTPSLTDGYMYWIDAHTRKIQRANLDGSNIQDVLTGLIHPLYLALDIPGGKIYWTGWLTGRIRSANLDGSNLQDLVVKTGQGNPHSIALDLAAGKMYWTEWTIGKIQRANLDGSNIEDLITTGLSAPDDIELDVANSKMYWTDTGTDKIQRANLDGSNIEDLVTTGLSAPDAITLDLVGRKVYWTDVGTYKIQRANLDGSHIEDLITTGLELPAGITLDPIGGKIYWTDWGTHKIQRANLDGSNIEDLVTTGLDAPIGIALSISQTGGGLDFSPNVIADQTFTVNTSVNLNLPNAVGGTAPYTYTLTPDLPAGLLFDALNRSISGTPTTPMPATPYTYTATDAAAQTASLMFTMTVTDTGPGPGGNLDVNGDGQVNVLDLILVAVFYGTRGDGLPADVNADGVVNVDDFAAVAAGVDAAGALPLQAVEAALLAAAAQAGDIEAVAGAPVTFNATHHAWSRQVAYHNVAAALADVRPLAASDARLGKGVALLSELLQLLKEMNAIPETTALLPNYPNPFNPETWIPYHLATEAEVTVTIYNVQGSAVRQLVLGHQPAGVYESRGRAAYWNGKNTLGEPVASGLYFYTLTAGEFNATRRLLIAK